jgi:GntR family transcriptional regulator
MQFVVDLTSHRAIYLQVMSQVKQAIASAELKPGDQLPTVRQLADELEVNFNTVARAYRLLDEEGIISTQHGRGSYILKAGSKRSKDRSSSKDLETLAENFLGEAQKMGFSLSETRKVFEKKLGDKNNEEN